MLYAIRGPRRVLSSKPTIENILFTVDYVVSSGAAAADKGYLSGAAASLDRAARALTLAALTTTNGSPRLYAGASRTWSRVSSSMIAPGSNLPR